SYPLEPQPLAIVGSGVVQKHRDVPFSEISTALIQALVAVEDKHFFSHPGLDPARIVKAAWTDLRDARKEQGASTLTMQLVRTLYLDPNKTWSRKLKEMIIAIVLEMKLSKQQIMEQYANRVYLGRRDGVSIQGFGEAAQCYFSHNLYQLTLS